MFVQTAFLNRFLTVKFQYFQIILKLRNFIFALCDSTPEGPLEPNPPAEAASISAEDEDEAAATEEEQEEALMVPQVKVAEDGSLIIDEERCDVQ